jgi:hypothetical protein
MQAQTRQSYYSQYEAVSRELEQKGFSGQHTLSTEDLDSRCLFPYESNREPGLYASIPRYGDVFAEANVSKDD